ncbi:MAG: dynamin family protein [Roseiflexaceae bacterium]|jgi:small GTP-binding protein|nr:dynamin family protein [Chloroflexaceae bacterium]MCE2852453.1 dynamin family protein [Chloroflexaceae bacterium]
MTDHTTHAAHIRIQAMALLDALLVLCDDVYQGRRDVAERQVVAQTRAHLEDPFLVVVAGEFNAGKSSLINAILASDVMSEGATPTTDAVTMLRYAPMPMALSQQPGWVVRALPVPLLQRLSIVDTPGTNAVIRQHEVLTREIVPRADVVLFVTSADRPFSETERAFLAMLHEWQRKVIILINKIDLLSPTESADVQAFVRAQATTLFGATPLIMPVSARTARPATADAYAAGGFAPLMAFLNERLDDQTRLRIRLESPLGVATQTHAQLSSIVTTQRATVTDDVQTVAYLDGQIQQFVSDMRRDVAGHRAAVAATLSHAEVRGMQFFDEQIRILNLHRLLRGDTLQQAFEQEVAADLASAIEAHTQQLVDWMIERNLQLWQSVVEYLRRRPLSSTHMMMGEVTGTFQYNRQQLIRDIVTQAGQIVASYDRSAEASHVAMELRDAVATTAVVQVGAVGIGALIATLLKGAVFDTTGIVAASVIAIGGLYIIPSRRAALKRQLHERLSDVRTRLMETIDAQFDQELERMVSRLREAIAPYTRLVASEVQRLDTIDANMLAVQHHIAEIRADIVNAFGEAPTQ